MERFSIFLRLFIFGSIAFCISSNSHAISFSLLGTGVIAQPVNGSSLYVGRIGYGGGFILESGYRPMAIAENGHLVFASLELTSLYLVQNYAGTGSIAYNFTEPGFNFQLLARLWLFKYLAIGLGAYGTYFMKITYTAEDGTFTSDPATPIDFGFVLSARTSISQLPGSIFLDFRYSQGLQNVVSSGTAHFTAVFLMLGIRLDRTPYGDYKGVNDFHKQSTPRY